MCSSQTEVISKRNLRLQETQLQTCSDGKIAKKRSEKRCNVLYGQGVRGKAKPLKLKAL